MNNNFLGYLYKDTMHIFEMFYMISHPFHMYFYNFTHMHDDDHMIIIKLDNYIYMVSVHVIKML